MMIGPARGDPEGTANSRFWPIGLDSLDYHQSLFLDLPLCLAPKHDGQAAEYKNHEAEYEKNEHARPHENDLPLNDA